MNYEIPKPVEEENAEKYFQDMIQEVKNLTGGKTIENQKWADIVRVLGETPCKIHVKKMGKTCRTCNKLHQVTQAILKNTFRMANKNRDFKNIMDDSGIAESEYLEKNKLTYMNKLLKENVLNSEFFRDKLLECYTAEDVFRVNRKYFDTLYPWKNERKGIPSNFHACVMKLAMLDTDYVTIKKLISASNSETEEIMRQIENEHFNENSKVLGERQEIVVEDVILGLIYLRNTLRFQKALKIFSKFLGSKLVLVWGDRKRDSIRSLVKSLLQKSTLFGLRLYRYPLVLERKIRYTLEKSECEEERPDESEEGRGYSERRSSRSRKLKKKIKKKKKKKQKKSKKSRKKRRRSREREDY